LGWVGFGERRRAAADGERGEEEEEGKTYKEPGKPCLEDGEGGGEDRQEAHCVLCGAVRCRAVLCGAGSWGPRDAGVVADAVRNVRVWMQLRSSAIDMG
jgi:hypothetical protein